MRKRSRRFFVILGVAIVSTAACSRSRADDMYYFDDPSDFGHVDQNSAGITNGSEACGPTAVYNSFQFLKNEYGVDLTGTSAASTINVLEDDMNSSDNGFTGVQHDNDLVEGKKTYIDYLGDSDKVVVESLVDDPNAIPGEQAADFIYDQLSAGQDIEVGFFWSNANGVATSGGHWVTITGIDFNPLTDTGTVSLVDPWGGVDIPEAHLTVVNGELVIGYSGGGAAAPVIDGQDPDNPSDSGFGFITGIAAESVVPLPAAVWSGIALVSGLILGRHGRAPKIA